MKEAKNELLQFVGGVIMLVVGLYILSQKVMVSSSYGIWIFFIMGWQVLIRSYYGTINNRSCMDVCYRWFICI